MNLMRIRLILSVKTTILFADFISIQKLYETWKFENFVFFCWKQRYSLGPIETDQWLFQAVLVVLAADFSILAASEQFCFSIDSNEDLREPLW